MNFTIYIYHDGSNLYDVVDQLELKVKSIVDRNPNMLFVNNLYPKEGWMRDEDLPDWDLGVNFSNIEMSHLQLEETFKAFQNLSDETKRNFAVGYVNQNQISEDIGYIQPFKSHKGILAILEKIK